MGGFPGGGGLGFILKIPGGGSPRRGEGGGGGGEGPGGYLRGNSGGREGPFTPFSTKRPLVPPKVNCRKMGFSSRKPHFPTSTWCDDHPFQNHYTHKIFVFKLFRSLQLQFSGPTGMNFRCSYSFVGLTGIFLYSYSSVQLHKKMVHGIIFRKLQVFPSCPRNVLECFFQGACSK